MTHIAVRPDMRRVLLLAIGLVVGLAFATMMAGFSWQAGAGLLGLGLAAIVGLAQTCSA